MYRVVTQVLLQCVQHAGFTACGVSCTVSVESSEVHCTVQIACKVS